MKSHQPPQVLVTVGVLFIGVLLPWTVTAFDVSRGFGQKQGRELVEAMDHGRRLEAILSEAQDLFNRNNGLGIEGSNHHHTSHTQVRHLPVKSPRANHRQLASKNRKLKSELDKCKADLETCTAITNSERLYVLMASRCQFQKNMDNYYLQFFDVEPAMYNIVGRPWQSAGTLTTTFYWNYVFEELYESSLYDVVITVQDDNFDFSGPILTTLVSGEMVVAPYTLPKTRAQWRRFKTNPVGYKYQLAQDPTQLGATPLDQLYGGFINTSVNASLPLMSYHNCMMIIGDPLPAGASLDTTVNSSALKITQAGEAGQAFFKPKFNPQQVAADLDKASSIFESFVNEPLVKGNKPAAELQKVADFKKQNLLSTQGKPTDPKDWVNGLGSALKTTAGTVQKCASPRGCDSKDLTNDLGSLMMGVAFVAGAACPPVGVVIAAVGFVISLASILLPGQGTSSIPAISTADIQKVVESVLSRNQISSINYKFQAYQTFAQIDVDIYKGFLNQLKYIREKDGDSAQPKIDQQIKDWSNQWYSGWGNYLNGLTEMESEFNNRLKDGPNSVRERLKQWINGCDANNCEIHGRPGGGDIIGDGNNRFSKCYKDMSTAQDDYNNLLSFSNSYMMAAFKFWEVVSTVQSIFMQASNCHDDPFKPDCSWNTQVQEYSKKVWVVTSRAFYLRDVLDSITVQCNTNEHGWPFSQKCSMDWCNFKTALALSRTQKNNRLGQLNSNTFFQLDDSYLQSDSEKTCQNDWNKWHEQLGFGYGGLFGYTDDSRMLKSGNCHDITDHVNGLGNIIFGAIPSFCIPPTLDKCKLDIVSDILWGFKA